MKWLRRYLDERSPAQELREGRSKPRTPAHRRAAMIRKMAFRILGTYLEACNCDAICPCRTIAGVPGGRSTHGLCYGVLTWRVDKGQAQGVDLAGSGALMTYSYDDDEPDSPWTLVLYVDGPGELADVLLGRLGGEHLRTLPWIRKHNKSVAVRRAQIAFGEGEVAIGTSIRLRATTPVVTNASVSCIVPGHDRPGTELVNDEVLVKDRPFDFELHGTCAFARDFDYAG
jgi:Protein of unknown function (DUF1326)